MGGVEIEFNICFEFNSAKFLIDLPFSLPIGGSQRKSDHLNTLSTPTVYTFPHFLDAETLMEESKFIGLQPNRTLHESFIEVDYDGTRIYERKNLQLNIDTSRAATPRGLFIRFELFFPVAWWSEESTTKM